MKTVFHSNVDGYEIITGFADGNGFIDPVATEAKIGETLRAHPATVAMVNLKNQINAARSQAYQLGGQIQSASARGDTATAQKLAMQAQSLNLQAQSLEIGLPEAIEQYEAVRAGMIADNAVYTAPGAGEELIADDQYATLSQAFALKAYGQALKLDGTYIADLRGETFWMLAGSTWTKTEITALGVDAPSGSIAEDQLTSDQWSQINAQAEAARVAALTPDEKLAEATAAQSAAKAVVAQVQAEATAGISTIAQVQAAVTVYQTTLAGINSKYGTSLT